MADESDEKGKTAPAPPAAPTPSDAAPPEKPAAPKADPLKEPVFIYPVPNQNSGGDGADPDQRKPTTNLESGTVVDLELVEP